MSHSSVRSTAETGKTLLAIVAILSLLLSLFAVVRPVIAVEPPGGGAADCPEGTIFLDNFGSGELVVGLELAPGVTITARTPATGEPESVTVTNESDGNITIAVKGGSDQVGNFVTIAAGASATISVTNNPTISNLSVCEGPFAPELEIEKSASVTSVEAGDGFTYTITVENTGDADATGVVITDDLDDSLTVDSATVSVDGGASTDCTVGTGNTISCDVGTLEPDAIATATIAVTTSAESCDEVRNTSTVDSNEQEPEDSNEVVVGVVCAPELEIEKSADATSVNAGDAFNYTITVENTGDADATGVVVTDDLDDSLTVDSAAWSVDGGASTDCTVGTGNTISCDIGTLAPASIATVAIAVTTSAESCDEVRNTSTVDSNEQEPENSNEVIVGVVCEDLGSITINKEVDCEECITRTPGFWFNSAGSHDTETNELMAGLAAADGGSNAAAVEVNIDGTVYEFVDAQDVRDFIAADTSGEWDDEAGLSRDGALLRHYLSTWLNVALNGEECDLLSRELNGQSVEAILAEAKAALMGLDEAAEVAALEKLTTINESDDAEENPLTCGDSENTSGDGFMFELFAQTDFPDGDPIRTGTTGEVVPGTLVFSDLPLGTYVLVETGNDSEQECEIVSVDGGVLNADGTVTVEITTDTPDVVLTIVNECEGGEEEPNPGDITVIKEAGDDAAAEFAFSATWDGDGFVLTDGDSEFSGDLEAGEFTVTETLTPQQIAAGWTLADIDCGDAVVDVDLAASTVTITLGEDDHVTCTFTNEQEEEGELVEIDKLFCFTDNEEGSTEFFFPGEVSTLGAETELPEEGCWTEAVSFTITGGALSEPLEIMTDANGSLEFTLPASDLAYTITEDLSGASAQFFVEEGSFTVILVLNLVPEEEDTGLVKVIKLFCEGDETSVEFIVEGEDAPVPLISGCELGDATFELGDMEIETEGGLALVITDVGEYTFAEIDPNEATYEGTITVVEGEITTIIVINTFEEGEEPGGGGPGTNVPPREGTQGGNPLPNTATSPIPTGSVPAALLALLMLAGLGAAGYAVRTEAQRRR